MKLKPGFYLHTFISHTTGDTIYLVHDAIGAVFTTSEPSLLKPFLAV